MKLIGLLFIVTGCYGGQLEAHVEDHCAYGLGTLDPTPGDCVVIKRNPLTPSCPYSYGFSEEWVYEKETWCSAVESVGERLFLMNAEVTYGPLAPGEDCSCAYVSRSR